MTALTPCLYTGRVMHLRLLRERNRKHRFRYRVFRLWLDIDRIDETLSRLWTVSHNGVGLFAFHDRDHGARDGSSLRIWVEARLAERGVTGAHRIMLYCFPRVLGYEFNPLAMYCAYDRAERPIGVVYQVRNTDGDLKPYAFSLLHGEMRHGARKDFYVSPFIDGDQRYSFHLHEPSETMALRIRVDGKDGLTLIATENAERRTLADAALLRLFFLQPLMTVKVTAGIYYEAARLRLKGARFHRHPGNDGRYAPEGGEAHPGHTG